MPDSANLQPNDLRAFWMPFTANRQFKSNPRMLVSARDMHYTTVEGRHVLDGTAGLWCVNAGHARPKIVQAVQDQVAQLDYAPAFQMGHPKAFELANRLVDITPDGMNHCFYTNSGSESGRDRAEDGDSLSAGARRGEPHAADRPRARLSRGEFRWHIGRRHRRQPEDVRHPAVRCRPVPYTHLTLPTNGLV